jgi:para-nitrobenzyl esterase
MIRPLLALGSAGLLAMTSAASAATPAPPVVEAPAGALAGETAGDLHVFRGIPYALPPVGARRWRPPAPMPRWEGTRAARDFGPACLQPPQGSLHTI